MSVCLLIIDTLLPATVGQHVAPGGGGTGGVQSNLSYQEHIDDRVKDGVVHGVVDVAILVIVLPPATRICRLPVHVHCLTPVSYTHLTLPTNREV